MGLLLADRESGIVWLNYILSREGGQSKFGAMAESECFTSEQICYLTWQTKISPVISTMGGLVDIVQRRLINYDLNPKYF